MVCAEVAGREKLRKDIRIVQHALPNTESTEEKEEW